jgi:hypothetical protein
MSAQYMLAAFTAILAGAFGIVASYCSGNLASEHAFAQKQFEYRLESYAAFLKNIDQAASPALSQLLSTGSMIQRLATDGEIQMFEDRVAKLLGNQDIHHFHWQFTSAITPLRLIGSPRVNEICDDIQNALLQHDSDINWSAYTPEVRDFHDRWKLAQDSGSAYATDERIAGDDRLMIVSVAKLMQSLIDQLRVEMRQSN